MSTEDEIPSQFNEMDVLELIPVIIEQKRQGNVSPDEETTLKEIFGDLWILIEEEMSRSVDEEMNPILKALLQSNDNRLKRALVERPHQSPNYHAAGNGLEVYEENDIIGNTIDRVRVTRWPKEIVQPTVELSPQQRLMRQAAFQIRQWLDQNTNKIQKPSAVQGRANELKRMRQMRRKKNQQQQNDKKRGAARRAAIRRRNKNRRNGVRKQPQNQRPKRHMDDDLDGYVKDNHGFVDYADYEEDFYDSMTKPRSMRSSFRLFDEYDYNSEEDEAALEKEADDY